MLFQIANIGAGGAWLLVDVQRVAIRDAGNLHHLGEGPKGRDGQTKGEKRHMRSGEEADMRKTLN